MAGLASKDLRKDGGVSSVQGHETSLRHGCFLSDGQRLLTASGDRQVSACRVRLALIARNRRCLCCNHQAWHMGDISLIWRRSAGQYLGHEGWQV